MDFQEGIVRGFLHRPGNSTDRGLVLTHGASGNCKSPLLVAIADAFCAAGYVVLRCDLAFRQRRPSGPPSPSTSARDRESLSAAVASIRKLVRGPVVLGGHSYGGRQASMLAAAEPALADALFLLSYPLHPPGKPEQLRTAHFPALVTPAVFLHGTSDPFGSIGEMESAVRLIAAPTQLVPLRGAGHDLGRGKLDVGALAATHIGQMLER